MANAQLGAVVRHLQTVAGLSPPVEPTDVQLMERFLAGRDEAAFTTLLHRHGPMVLSVADRVVRNADDAEDVFQATFLLLARKASTIRRHDSVSSWLHGVAHRLALKVRTRGMRRQSHERQARTMHPARPESELAWHELQATLDAALTELPAAYRSALVLCYREGKTHEEIARQLGCPLGTVRSRVARGRKLLHSRLTRRGLSLSAATAVTVAAAGPAPAAVPPGLAGATVKAALVFAAGRPVVGLVAPSVAGLVQEWTRAALTTNLARLAAAVLAVGAVTATAGILARQTPAEVPPPAHAAAATAEKQPARAQAVPLRPEDSVAARGRVLDPDGRPLSGARLYVWGGLRSDRNPPVRATTDFAGRFAFTVAASELEHRDPLRPWWRNVVVVAVAADYGPNFVPIDPAAGGAELNVRVVRDDVPIQGRILDLEGRPRAGVTVTPNWLEATAGEDLTPYLRAAEANDPDAHYKFLQPRTLSAAAAGLPRSITTDAQGRFRLTGVGRERIVILQVQGDGLANHFLHVMTRPSTPRKVKEGTFTQTYFGAKFDDYAPPGRSITGTVRDHQTGKPVAGATVRGATSQARTDAEGRYRLTGVPKELGTGQRQLYAEPPADQPYLRGVATLPDSAGLETATVDFQLRSGRWITGKVTDEATGRPIPRVTVRYQPAPLPENLPLIGLLRGQVWTAADGSYRVLGLPGPGKIIVIAPLDDRYVPAGLRRSRPADWSQMLVHAVREVTVGPHSASGRCDLTLERGCEVSGTVLGPDGKPVTGCLVSGLSLPRWNWDRLPGAAFTAKALSPHQPPRTLLFYHAEKQLAGAVDLRGDQKGPVNVKLQPWGTVTGRLIDDNGEPFGKVVGTRMGLESWNPTENQSGHLARGLPELVHIDRTGRFRLEGLVPGRKYDFGAQGPNESPTWSIGGLLTSPGESKNLGDVKPMRFPSQ